MGGALSRLLWHVAVAAVLAAVGFGGITWFALESGGVAIVTTGDERETHVWFAELDDGLWLEAGAPENPWVRDIVADPTLRLRLPDGTEQRYRATIVPERSRDVRTALRAAYGWRDIWVGQLVDAGRSQAVRLDPIP